MSKYRRIAKHRCEVDGCREDAQSLMCPVHWAMLPKWMRFRLLDLERPSVDWVTHADACIDYLRRKAQAG